MAFCSDQDHPLPEFFHIVKLKLYTTEYIAPSHMLGMIWMNSMKSQVLETWSPWWNEVTESLMRWVQCNIISSDSAALKEINGNLQ